MSAFAVALAVFTFLILLYVGYELRREQRRTRILGAFIAGLIARELDNGVDYDQLLFYISVTSSGMISRPSRLKSF